MIQSDCLTRALSVPRLFAWCRTTLAIAILFASSRTAYAEATVVVELKSPDGAVANGTVQLTKGETRLRCTTRQGRCELKNVTGGTYTVVVEQEGQPTGKAKTVMIPPHGEVKLIVAAKP